MITIYARLPPFFLNFVSWLFSMTPFPLIDVTSLFFFCFHPLFAYRLPYDLGSSSLVTGSASLASLLHFPSKIYSCFMKAYAECLLVSFYPELGRHCSIYTLNVFHWISWTWGSRRFSSLPLGSFIWTPFVRPYWVSLRTEWACIQLKY